MTKKIMSGNATWQDLFQKHDFFTRYKSFISVTATAETEETLNTWSGFVESRLRHLVLKLEYFDVFHLVHPFVKGFQGVVDKNVDGGPPDGKQNGEGEEGKESDVKKANGKNGQETVGKEADGENGQEADGENGQEMDDEEMNGKETAGNETDGKEVSGTETNGNQMDGTYTKTKEEKGDTADSTEEDTEETSEQEKKEVSPVTHYMTFYIGLDIMKMAGPQKFDLRSQALEFMNMCKEWNIYDSDMMDLRIQFVKRYVDAPLSCDN
jgi:poly(A) polymerase Pap1